MESRNEQLNYFFDQYANRFNKALRGESNDIEGTVASFANYFIEAGPSGVNCGRNDKQFREVIPQGYEFYRNIGIKSMDIISKTITLLDNVHTMTKIHWKSDFIRKDGVTGNIEFDIIYLVQSIDNMHKIFAYITGDEQAAMKEKGLI